MRQAALLALVALAAVGCSSPETEQQPEAPVAAVGPTVTQDLDSYSQTVVAATGGNISNPTPAQKTGDKPMLSYVVKFHTSDPALMAKEDGDTNKISYAFNGALQEAWSRRFCTPQLKSIMAKHEVFLVSGHLLDAGTKMQVFTSCML